MTYVRYPSTLPCPRTSTVTPAERRQLSQPERPRDAVAIERDRTQLERIAFPTFSAAQAEAFRTWWEDTLFYGAHWFAADWPSPVGLVDVVRRFISAPQWSFVPGGFWDVSAVCEVRGRGELPRVDPLPLFLLHLDGSFVDEMGATFAPNGSLITAPTFVDSATGFGQQSSHPGSGNTLVRSLYPEAERFVDAAEWQFDAFVTCADANGLARTVIEISATNNVGVQNRLLWINFSDAGDSVNVQLDVRARTGVLSESALSAVDLAASRVPAGQRAHVRVTQQAGVINAYVDGVLCLSRSSPVFTAVAGTFTQVTLGAALSGYSAGNNVYSSFMDGQIDEVRFTDTVTDAGNFEPPTRPFTVPIS